MLKRSLDAAADLDRIMSGIKIKIVRSQRCPTQLFSDPRQRRDLGRLRPAFQTVREYDGAFHGVAVASLRGPAMLPLARIRVRFHAKLPTHGYPRHAPAL